ncbi:Cupredoxin, partial [Mycena rosella]
FNPNQITAPNGTVVTFQFTGIPGNHSVTQSSFDAPCQPLKGGFDSGWILIEAGTTAPPQWSINITNDQTPIWFFCKQLIPSPHCTAGMVGVINVKPGANSFSAFQSAAE